MKKPLALLGVSAVVGFGALLISGPAQAGVTDCRSVVVSGRSGPDSGENGNNWATVTLTRNLKVCATEMPAAGDWTYKATVADNGTFVTLVGDSPGAGTTAKLKGGFTGKVVGGFEAAFTAPKWTADFKLTAPPKTTLTGDWVKTAFHDATFDGKGSVAKWGWTYTTCGGNGEKWINAESGNSGDITEKACPKPPVVVPPAAKNCEAYLYTGTTQNLCDRFANVTGKVNCKDVGYRVTLVNKNNDPWGLDANGKGIPGVGCESYPKKPKSTPTPTTTANPTTSPASGGLPVTGDSNGKKVAAAGGLAIVVGAIAVVVARKRRETKFIAE